MVWGSPNQYRDPQTKMGCPRIDSKTMMATAQWATMTTTMARRATARQDTTTTTMATGNDKNDNGDGPTGDGATGNNNDDDCNDNNGNGMTGDCTAGYDDNDDDGGGTTGNEVDDYGEGATMMMMTTTTTTMTTVTAMAQPDATIKSRRRWRRVATIVIGVQRRMAMTTRMMTTAPAHAPRLSSPLMSRNPHRHRHRRRCQDRGRRRRRLTNGMEEDMVTREADTTMN